MAVESESVKPISIYSGTYVSIMPFIVENYWLNDMLLTVDQIENPEISLQDISASKDANWRDLFCRYGYDYSWRTLIITSVQNEKSATSTSILDSSIGVLLYDGRHRLQTLRELQSDYNLQWLLVLILVVCITPNYGKSITHTEALKHRKLANNESFLVRRGVPFIASLKTLLKFAAMFEKEHGVSFSATQIVEIVGDIQVPELLTAVSFEIYNRYIRVVRFINERKENFRAPDILDVEEAVAFGG